MKYHLYCYNITFAIAGLMRSGPCWKCQYLRDSIMSSHSCFRFKSESNMERGTRKMNTHRVPITFLYPKIALLNYCIMIVTVILF